MIPPEQTFVKNKCLSLKQKRNRRPKRSAVKFNILHRCSGQPNYPFAFNFTILERSQPGAMHNTVKNRLGDSETKRLFPAIKLLEQ
jgi:hypothetical protein